MAYNYVKPKSAADMVKTILAEAIHNENGCMICIRAKDLKGYARIGFGGRGCSTDLAHRIVYKVTYGALPLNKPLVLHKCDTPSCINPLHLYAGSAADNTCDMMNRKRGANGTHRGY